MDSWPTSLAAAPRRRRLRKQRLPLSVLLPAHNESAAIPHVLNEIATVLQTAATEYEIVVVDDGSDDGTAQAVEWFRQQPLPANLREVRLIGLPEQRGAGAARKVGIRAARGEIVVMLDADGSYPAAAIPALLRHFPDYDQVNGARTSEQGSWPWLRRPAKWLIRMLASYLTGRRIPDLNTGLKAFRRDEMLRWLWCVPDGFSCVTTMTLAFLTNGYAVKYVPVEYRRRIGRSKFHPVKDTLSYLATVVRVVLYFRPLRIFGPLAAAAMLAGVGKTWHSVAVTGTMQESDIVVLLAAFMTGVVGLLAEVVVAQHRR